MGEPGEAPVTEAAAPGEGAGAAEVTGRAEASSKTDAAGSTEAADSTETAGSTQAAGSTEAVGQSEAAGEAEAAEAVSAKDGTQHTAKTSLAKSGLSKSGPSKAGLSKDGPDEKPADGAADDAAAAEQTDRRTGTGRRIFLAAAAVVLLAALITGAVFSVVTVRDIDQRAERRTEYVQTARQAILNLTTIRADSAKEDIDRILSLASGQFKTEFDGRVDPFLSIVQQAKVVSNGEIVEAALESDDDDSAKVLVAAKQTLTNAGQAEPQTRYYRFRVTVTRSDAGLTASNVEFVP
ncbi:conserved Mce associated membrane protein [Mycobacteroides abscessus subsp. abscessus]|nr:conserved Mce associated membrane protein [Mycobacteroides abscessus subsp. abscessus]